MNFPVWDVGFGLPLLIALVAIPHVFIAHFAIGGGLFLAVYESVAHRRGDAALLGYVREHSRFFLILTLVFGALSGVGIWFTIGLISPAATSALIHIFVWFWAVEWVMFVVEISASLVYFYGWDRLSPKRHVQVMGVYFVAAWGSLAVINGIITFMLTPGDWLATYNVWDGFFNPTYLPSLVFRTLLTLFMAGLFAFYTGSKLADPALKERVLRIASYWSLPALILLPPTAYWYFNALPDSVTNYLAGNWKALELSRQAGIWSAVLAAIGVTLSPLLRPRKMERAEAVLLLAVGLVLFGSFEWEREASRKPFVIHGYMYSNGIAVPDTGRLREAGLVESIKWKHSDPARRGEDLYRAACASCHSLEGYNGLARKIAERGWSEGDLEHLIPRTGLMRGAMPPFFGTEDEAEEIAAYLSGASEALAKDLRSDWGRTRGRPGDARLQVEGITAGHGKAVWERNCALCHTLDAHRPLHDAFSGMGTDDLKELLLSSSDLSPSMPPFIGTDADAAALAEYLTQLMRTPSNREKK